MVDSTAIVPVGHILQSIVSNSEPVIIST